MCLKCRHPSDIRWMTFFRLGRALLCAASVKIFLSSTYCLTSIYHASTTVVSTYTVLLLLLQYYLIMNLFSYNTNQFYHVLERIIKIKWNWARISNIVVFIIIITAMPCWSLFLEQISLSAAIVAVSWLWTTELIFHSDCYKYLVSACVVPDVGSSTSTR